MTNKFDEMLGKGKQGTTKGQEIEGSFSCQKCDRLVEIATLSDEVLTWKCSEGHTSKIKGFEL